MKCDVSSEEDGAAAVAAASEMGPLRALVNSAGLGRAARTIDRNNDPMPQSTFDFVIRINLLGSFNMLRLSAAAMAKTEPVDADGSRGAIVNMASVAAFDGQIGQAAYSASKGGVVGMTLPIARDLAAVGIRVNTIAPGLIDTPIYGTGEALRGVQGQPRPVGAVPEAPRHRRGAGLHGGRPDHQPVHERRDHPRRRRHPDAPEVVVHPAGRSPSRSFTCRGRARHLHVTLPQPPPVTVRPCAGTDRQRTHPLEPQPRRQGPSLQRWARALLRRPVRLLWPVDVSGAEHVPAEGAAILCPNHLSFFDSVFMMLTFERPVYFIGKSEYLDSWTTRRLFPAMGMIPIDRDCGARALIALDTAAAVLHEGAVLCIFPEGTRSRDGHLHRGYTGRARWRQPSDARSSPSASAGPPSCCLPGLGCRDCAAGAPSPSAAPDLGPAGDTDGGPRRSAARATTDELMQRIAALSGQEYVAHYSQRVRHEPEPAAPGFVTPATTMLV